MAAKFAKWFLYNLDTDDKFEGQFPAEDVTQDMGGVSLGEETALNRQHPIVQFLHGNAETVSFTGRLFAKDSTVSLIKPLKMLQSWTKRDPDLRRMPFFHFWIGDSTLKIDKCIVENISSINYHNFRKDGAPTDISFTVELREYYDFSFTTESSGETRYHRAKLNEYCEGLAQKEYKDPMMGVIIRDRHPTKPVLEVGDVVKLPELDVISDIPVEPTSLALESVNKSELSPQRTLRDLIFDRLNLPHTSHVI